MTTGVLTTSFPRYPGDFAGCFVEDAARAYAATGECVEVIAAAPGRPAVEAAAPAAVARPDLPSSIRVLWVETPLPPRAAPLFFGSGAPEALEGRAVAPWVQAGLFWAGLCERLRERAPAWDRIVAHWLLPSALAARTIAPQVPLTAYAHSGDVALLERIPGGAAIARKLARETGDLIFVSADLRFRFARLAGMTGAPPGRVARLPVGKPPWGTWRDDEPDQVGISVPERHHHGAPRDSRKCTVISVGRLVPIKGFDILLRAVASTENPARDSSHKRMKVVILGEGPERRRLERMAREMDIDLLLPGCVPRNHVALWLSAADIYVQSSRRLNNGRTEGLPLATLEALQAGLPVIVSNTGGLGELGGVQTVPSENVSALAACLGALVDKQASSLWGDDVLPEPVEGSGVRTNWESV